MFGVRFLDLDFIGPRRRVTRLSTFLAQSTSALALSAQRASSRVCVTICVAAIRVIFGVLPLTIAVGAGAEMRQSLGIAVFAGMIGVTLFGLLFTPAFYVAVRALPAHAMAWGEMRKRGSELGVGDKHTRLG